MHSNARPTTGIMHSDSQMLTLQTPGTRFSSCLSQSRLFTYCEEIKQLNRLSNKRDKGLFLFKCHLVSLNQHIFSYFKNVLKAKQLSLRMYAAESSKFVRLWTCWMKKKAEGSCGTGRFKETTLNMYDLSANSAEHIGSPSESVVSVLAL